MFFCPFWRSPVNPTPEEVVAAWRREFSGSWAGHAEAIAPLAPCLIELIERKRYMGKKVTVNRLYRVAAEFSEYVMYALDDPWVSGLVDEYSTVVRDRPAVLGALTDDEVFARDGLLTAEGQELYRKGRLTFRRLLTVSASSLSFP